MASTTVSGLCVIGCGEQIRTGIKYCSRKCAHVATTVPKIQCVNGCGNVVRAAKSRYCSFRCMHAHRHKCRVAAFFVQGGIYGHVPLHFLSRMLRERYGERCSRCGWAERHPKTGKIPVEVEHVDGNWQNNRIDNLTLLCPNCHALTPTFRALNRGRGRAHRLGGRGNPLKISPTPKAPVLQRPKKEFKLPLTQLPLLNADVAEPGLTHHSCKVAQKWIAGSNPAVG